MKKIYVYPFSDEVLNILDNKDMLKDFEIVGVINDNKSVGELLTNKYGCLSVDNEMLDDNQYFRNIDGVMLYSDGFSNMGKNKYIDFIVEKIIKYEKEIFFTNELKKYIDRFDYTKKTLIDYYAQDNIDLSQYELKYIDKPVILIMGLGENCDKTRVGLSLYKFFKNEGYKPSIVSSNSLDKLIGFNTFSFLNNNFNDEVKRYNYMLSRINMDENPDLLIVVAPSGVVKHDNRNNNLFGYPSYVITSAITPDITILSVYAGKYDIENINYLKNICYYKYNSRLSYIHIARTVCDMNLETNKLDYLQIDDVDAMKYLIEDDLSMYSTMDHNSTNKIHSMILEELRGNVKQI